MRKEHLIAARSALTVAILAAELLKRKQATSPETARIMTILHSALIRLRNELTQIEDREAMQNDPVRLRVPRVVRRT